MELVAAVLMVLVLAGIPTVYVVFWRGLWPGLEKTLTVQTGELEFSCDVPALERRLHEIGAKTLPGKRTRFVIESPPRLFTMYRRAFPFVAEVRGTEPGQSQLRYTVIFEPLLVGVIVAIVAAGSAAFLLMSVLEALAVWLFVLMLAGVNLLLWWGVARAHASRTAAYVSAALAQEEPGDPSRNVADLAAHMGWSVARKLAFGLGFGITWFGYVFASSVDDAVLLEWRPYLIWLVSGAAVMIGAALVGRYRPFGGWLMRAGCIGAIAGTALLAARGYRSWGLLGWILFGVMIIVTGGLATYLCRLAERGTSNSRS